MWKVSKMIMEMFLRNGKGDEREVQNIRPTELNKRLADSIPFCHSFRTTGISAYWKEDGIWIREKHEERNDFLKSMLWYRFKQLGPQRHPVKEKTVTMVKSFQAICSKTIKWKKNQEATWPHHFCKSLFKFETKNLVGQECWLGYYLGTLPLPVPNGINLATCALMLKGACFGWGIK